MHTVTVNFFNGYIVDVFYYNNIIMYSIHLTYKHDGGLHLKEFCHVCVLNYNFV